MKFAKEMHEIAENINNENKIESESIYLKFKKEILSEVKHKVDLYAHQGFFNTVLDSEVLFYELGMKPECLPLLKNDLENEGFIVNITQNYSMLIGW